MKTSSDNTIHTSNKPKTGWRDIFVSKQKRHVRQILDRGWKTHDESDEVGSRKEVLALVDKVLEIEPKNAEAFLLRAHALLSAEGAGLNAALRSMDTAIQLDRTVARHGRMSRREMAHIVGSTYATLEEYDNALYTADDILSQHPTNDAAIKLKVKCLNNLDRNKDALRFIDTMIKRRQLLPPWSSQRGLSRRQLNPDWNKTITASDLEHCRARILAEMHDHEGAKEAFQKCLKHHKAGINIFRSAMHYFFEHGFHEEAWTSFTNNSDYREQLTKDEYLRLVKSQRQLNKNPLSLLNTALGLHPHSAELHFEKAVFLLEKENARHAAMAHLKDAVKYRPNYRDAWYQLGRIHEQEEQLEHAEASYGKALSIDSTHELSKDAIKRIQTLNQIHGKTADEFFNKAYLKAWLWLGSLHEKQGNQREALKYFTYAMRTNPEHEQSRLAFERLSTLFVDNETDKLSAAQESSGADIKCRVTKSKSLSVK